MNEKNKFWRECRIGLKGLCMIGILCLSGCGNSDATVGSRNEDTYIEEIQKAQDEVKNDVVTELPEYSQDETETNTNTEDSVEQDIVANTKDSAEQDTQENVQEDTADVKTAVLNSDYNTEIFQELYNMKNAQENALDFSGEWHRTNEVSGFFGTVMISEQDAEGFNFSGGFCYYSHSGEIEGRAYFVAEDIAIYQYENEYQDAEAEDEYIAFVKMNDGLQIRATGNSGELGFGMNVFADGEYTLGEPAYTNANILAETFTEEELSQIEQMLGQEWYEEYFVFAVEEGIITASDCILADGENAVFYDAFVPTMGGYEFTMLFCEDGSIYYYSGGEPGWQTNVSGAIDFPVYELVSN